MDYYTVEQAADRLGLNKTTISRYLRDGKIKGFRVGGNGKWRIDKASFDAFCNPENSSGPNAI